MQENARVMEEQRLTAIRKVKHTVTVCTWLVVRDSFKFDLGSLIHYV